MLALAGVLQLLELSAVVTVMFTLDVVGLILSLSLILQ